MQTSIRNRLARLEAMHRPPAEVWSIGVIVREMDENGQLGREVGRIEPRLIEPGAFDYVRLVNEMVRAHGYDDDATEL